MPESPRDSNASPSAGAYPLLAAIVLVWGFNWPIVKIGLDYIHPWQFTAARMLMGAGCMFAVVVALGRLRLPGRADLPVLFSVGLLQIGLFLALINLALVYVEAGRSAILAYTTPLWVAPLAVFVLGERMNRLKLAGLAAGLGGIAVLFNPFGFDWGDPDVVLGNGLLMLAALGWAIAILHVRAHRWRLSPLELAPWQFLLASVPATALAWWIEGDMAIAWTGTLIAVLVYNGPLATAFCFWAAVTVTRRLPATTTSLSNIGVPVAGLFTSALILGEALTPAKLAGLALIVGGVALAALADRRRARTAGGG